MSVFIEAPTSFGFRFRGGIASSGHLNFYEAGRYRYGAARLLYLVENYRQTGVVLTRMTNSINADFRISAPQSGSFVEWVELLSAPLIADANVIETTVRHLHLDTLLAFIFSKVVPRPSSSSQLEKIVPALIELGKEREKSVQSREHTARLQETERTKQLELLLRALKGDPDGLRDNNSEAKIVATQLELAVQERADLRIGSESGAFLVNELKAEVRRDETVNESSALAAITQENEDKLTGLARHLLPEMAKPLNRSATEFDLDVGSNDNSLLTLSKSRVSQITKIVCDEKSVTMAGNVVRLDKESGAGRFRPNGSKLVLSFYIPRDDLNLKRSKFIDALGALQVELVALPYRDGVGNIVRLTVFDVK